ncbi:hypothetical protein A2631_01435 [Candidatus Daviesbacteria bacterium RIFCSPHIGHO2_01_FULL_44_29]|nr:MAG: hypothetical protein A2631_01435 [Candidatus Daviesbacteria bacterium RIFCSPHIGHO2_01_FULL_44_29]
MATLGRHHMGRFTAEVVDWSPNGYVRDRRGRVYYNGFFVADSCVTYREGRAYPRDWASGVIEQSYTLVGADSLSGQAVELLFSVDNEDRELGLLTASTYPLGFLTNFHAPETMAKLLEGVENSKLVAPTYNYTNVLRITSPFEQNRLARALGLLSGNSAVPSPSGYNSTALLAGGRQLLT